MLCSRFSLAKTPRRSQSGRLALHEAFQAQRSGSNPAQDLSAFAAADLAFLGSHLLPQQVQLPQRLQDLVQVGTVGDALFSQ